MGLFNGDPAIIVLVTRQPGANIIETVDAVRALLPDLQAQLPQDIQVAVASDSTNSIRSSLHEIELTLMVSIALVVLVVGLFLRKARATVIPAVATVVSLLGTFGVMYFLGFSLNNLSLMALTVATGFVVDDAIVVLENTMRHIEAGMDRMQAALQGAREVGFTVLSISLSLVAVRGCCGRTTRPATSPRRAWRGGQSAATRACCAGMDTAWTGPWPAKAWWCSSCWR